MNVGNDGRQQWSPRYPRADGEQVIGLKRVFQVADAFYQLGQGRVKFA